MADTTTTIRAGNADVQLRLSDNGDGTFSLGTAKKSKTIVAVEFTRPANATPYTAGDVVSNDAATTTPMAFANLLRVVAGTGYIVGARLVTDRKSITPRFRVHLFKASDMTLAADNAAHKRLYADNAKSLGAFELPAMQTPADAAGSDISYANDLGLRHPIQVPADSRTIWAVLEALDAFTPASGEKFTLTLFAEDD